MSGMKTIDQLKDVAKKAGVVLLIFCGVQAFFYGYITVVNRIHESTWEKEKECFKELTLIMEQSSPERKEWIKNTILAERSVLGTNYCSALELVKEASPEPSGKEENGE